MGKTRNIADTARRVWRITAEAPLGEFVDAETAAASRAPRLPGGNDDAEPRPSNWTRSSYDLLNGIEISESSPGEFDALFNSSGAALRDDEPPRDAAPVGRDQWLLRFALRLAELDPRAEPRDVIALGKSIWPTKHFLTPEEAARSEYRWGIRARSERWL